MTQFLIRLFIRQPDHAQDPKVRAAYGNLACWVGVACNLLLCLGKLTVGTLFGSIAIMADALNNLSDASSNVVSLVGFKLAGKAPDAEHPFGHARYEYLAGLVVSVTILGIGFSLLKESVVKVLHPTPVMFSWLTVAVLIASILVKLWMSGFNRTIGRIIGSETLIATAADSRNDVLSTSTSAAQVALTLRAVQDHLVAGVSMNGGHDAGDDGIGLVQGVGHGGQAVGGAGSSGDDLIFSGQGLLVDGVDDGLQVVAGGSRDNDLAGACVDMSLALSL